MRSTTIHFYWLSALSIIVAVCLLANVYLFTETRRLSSQLAIQSRRLDVFHELLKIDERIKTIKNVKEIGSKVKK